MLVGYLIDLLKHQKRAEAPLLNCGCLPGNYSAHLKIKMWAFCRSISPKSTYWNVHTLAGCEYYDLYDVSLVNRQRFAPCHKFLQSTLQWWSLEAWSLFKIDKGRTFCLRCCT